MPADISSFFFNFFCYFRLQAPSSCIPSPRLLSPFPPSPSDSPSQCFSYAWVTSCVFSNCGSACHQVFSRRRTPTASSMFFLISYFYCTASCAMFVLSLLHRAISLPAMISTQRRKYVPWLIQAWQSESDNSLWMRETIVCDYLYEPPLELLVFIRIYAELTACLHFHSLGLCKERCVCEPQPFRHSRQEQGYLVFRVHHSDFNLNHKHN